jgi:hypothetical protein
MPAASRWAGLVFALLALATLAAFAWSQRLKRDPLVLDRVTFAAPLGPQRAGPDQVYLRSFTPNRDCRFDRVRIRFRVTQSDLGTVQVVKPGGRLVVTLARDSFLKRYTFHTFYWDGRQRGGGTADPGRYKLRVKLGEDRVLVPPGVMRLHRAERRPAGECGARTGGGEP